MEYISQVHNIIKSSRHLYFKLFSMEFDENHYSPVRNKQSPLKTSIIVVASLVLVIFPILVIIQGPQQPVTILNSWSLSFSSSVNNTDVAVVESPLSSSANNTGVAVVEDSSKDIAAKDIAAKRCDLFKGDWVPDQFAPYYTNETCFTIYQHQNCMKYGRPDLEFLKWRWKPDDCELPIFNPLQFLEIVRGKSLAFVGDSVARNHMQSLLCLLSRVDSAIDITNTTNPQSTKWRYPHYNFTIENFWSPYLVKTSDPVPTHTKQVDLYLDEFDEWTRKIEPFDYVIISGGHWFFQPFKLFENKTFIGCHYCPWGKNLRSFDTKFAFRKAFHTAFRAINSLTNFRGIIFLRTFAPSHFEKGPWNNGGVCTRTRPFKRNETRLEDDNLEFHKAQLEEFRVAEIEGVNKGLKFRLLDTTQVMLMRPDGHPSKYGHPASANYSSNDCLHWCLPGPIDTWNDFLLELLRLETMDSL